MARNAVVSTGMLLALGGMVPVYGVGRVGPDAVAGVVDAMKAEDLAQAEAGELLLGAASKARVGQKPVGMQGVPPVGGAKRDRQALAGRTTSSAGKAKIVDPARSCAAEIRRRVRILLFGR